MTGSPPTSWLNTNLQKHQAVLCCLYDIFTFIFTTTLRFVCLRYVKLHNKRIDVNEMLLLVLLMYGISS